MILLKKTLDNRFGNSFAVPSRAGITCGHTFGTGAHGAWAEGGGFCRDESSQEVAAVKLVNSYLQPSMPPAACAQVPGVRGSFAAAADHATRVPETAVPRVSTSGTPQTRHQQVSLRQRAGSQAANGLVVKETPKTKMIFGAVRGVPPRGRPV